MSDIYHPPPEAQVRLRDGNLIVPMPLELEHRIGMLNHRYRQILERASELGAERYQLTVNNDPSCWHRLAAIDLERATLEAELQHLHHSLVEAGREMANYNAAAS